MAEIKTYKCDICGGVYHYDKNDYNNMVCVTDRFAEYHHICEKCSENIRKVIEDPKAFEKLSENMKTELRGRLEYKHALGVVYMKTTRDMFPFHDPEQLAEKIIDKFKEVNNSRDNWKFHAALGYTWGAVLSIVLIFIIVGRIISLFA